MHDGKVFRMQYRQSHSIPPTRHIYTKETLSRIYVPRYQWQAAEVYDVSFCGTLIGGLMSMPSLLALFQVGPWTMVVQNCNDRYA